MPARMPARSFNGLAYDQIGRATNTGTESVPAIAGDTVYAWSEVLDRAVLSDTVGALRLRLVATSNQPCEAFPLRDADGRYAPGVILDFDYWAAIPRRAG